MLIVLILVILIVIVSVYSKKWIQNYIQIFIFGKKGSGKTALLVRYMTEYHKKGYSVYTNLRNCTLPYVVQIDVDQLGEYVAKPKSLIALDEVGIDFDARKFKTFKDSWRDYFKFQRQYQNVVVMTSQAWDVDLKVRNLTDRFYLAEKWGPFSVARLIVRKITLTEPVGDSESRIADQLRFKPFSARITYIPKYGKWYQTFSPPERPYFPDPPVIESSRSKKGVRIKRTFLYGNTANSRKSRQRVGIALRKTLRRGP